MVELFGVVVPVIYAHLGGLLFLVVVILWGEKEAFAWMRGKRETLPKGKLALLHTLVWVGLAVMIVSGLLLAWPLADYVVQSPAFYLKMAFVLVLVVNSFFIGAAMKVASEKPFVALTPTERLPILVTGGVSAVSWIGAFIAALYMSTSQWLLYFWNLALSFVF